MYILMILWPLLAALLAGICGDYFGRWGSSFISFSIIVLCFFLSLFIFLEVCLYHSTVVVNLFQWFLLDTYEVSFGLLIDPLTSIMMVIITFISALVHLYSISYMGGDPYLSRFMAYLSLFTFFMLVLVTSDNFVQLFIGWEGVGVCSYLLINFWHTRILANKAALKAMIMNRIADVFFIFAILLILLTFKTADYVLVFNLIPYVGHNSYVFFSFFFPKVDIIAFFLFIGAIGKSAQLGFHTWLPDAMEGPTPVSALLHAATMVTAGVFLMIRSSAILEYSDFTLFLLLMFGGVTTFFAGLIAIFQYDLKKIIAYSTTSQLGYMFFSCGLSNYYVSLFHLFNHAFFKALLFLCAGVIIHKMWDEQDIRRMGSLLNYMPYTYSAFLIGSLAIMGFPFLTGFYSKDVLLESAYSSYLLNASFIYFLGISSAMFTAAYSLRLLYLVFFTLRANWIFGQFVLFLKESEEVDIYMFIPLFLLSLCSIFVGYLFSELMMGWGSNFWQNGVLILPHHHYFIELEFMDPLVKNLPSILSFFAMYLCYWVIFFTNACKREFDNLVYMVLKAWEKIFDREPRSSRLPLVIFNYYVYGRLLSPFFYHGAFVNNIYNFIFLQFFKVSYNFSHGCLEKGYFEFFGSFFLYKCNQGIYHRLFSLLPSSIYRGFFFFLGGVFFVLLIASFNFNESLWSILPCLYLNPGLMMLMLINLIICDKQGKEKKEIF